MAARAQLEQVKLEEFNLKGMKPKVDQFNDIEGLTDSVSNFWLLENIIEFELILFSR